MDLQDLNDLRAAKRSLELMVGSGVSAANQGALRQDAVNLIERVLSKHPLVKDPVGGNIDVTVQGEPKRLIQGGDLDRRI